MKRRYRGYILLEALVAIAIMGFLIISVLPSVGFLLQRSRGSVVNTDANLYLQEGMEVAYNAFATDWTLANGTYKVAINSSSGSPKWELRPAPDDLLEAKYTRIITVAPVIRDPSTGLQGPGDVDPLSRKVTTSVSWAQGTQTNSITAQLLLIKP